MTRKALLALCVGASTSALALAAPARAQMQLEEIVVTAEKRETRVQTTPIAMSALSGEMLQNRQITNVEGLMAALPNVDFGLGLGNARIAIRGIGFDNVTGGNEARVAYHQDGVYFSRPYSVTPSFFDVERVEVLRGPQGTLYGRNATGGVVNVITRDPGSALNGFVSVTGGNYDLIKVEGAIGGPIADTLSARLSFQSENRGGYGKNELTGDDTDDMDIYSVRGKLRFEPSETFNATLFADYSHENDHAYGYLFFGPNPTNNPALGAAGPIPRPVSGTLFGGILPSKLGNDTGDQPTRNKRDFKGLGGTINFTAGGLDFTSISAWRAAKYHVTGDADSTSAPFLALDQFETSKQYSEEFRISYSGEKVDWLVGAYYFHEKLETGNRFAADLFRGTIFFNPLTPAIACGGRPCTGADLDPRGLTTMYQPQGRLRTEAWAIFGNVHYRFSDKAGLRLGLRYSDESKKVFNQTKYNFATFNAWPPFPSLPFANCGAVPFPFCIYSEQRASKSYRALSPSITLDYRATPDLYLYATYSKGMKSGGFNLGNNQPGFDKELVTDYEVGMKAEWMDGRLRTNLAAFYYDYKDAQATTILGTPPRIEIVNAPGAKQYGIEVEAVALPAEGLRLDMDFAWLHSEYKGPFLSQDSGQPWLGTTDQAGNQLVYAPKFTFGFGAEYTWAISNIDVTVRAETKYKDRTYFDIFNRQFVSQGAHWKANAFLTLQPREANWSAQLFVRNITNERTITAMNVGAAFTGGQRYGALSPPRTVGVTLNYQLK
jgi:iron complex outermembrane receptor protein